MSDAITDLIALFARLPGVGRKTATRMVFHLMDARPEYATKLGKAICQFHQQIVKCPICGNVSSHSPCSICTDDRRDGQTICVVEHVPDLWALEASGNYRGRYHVLHGLLSPLDGIGPADLHIDELADRIKTQNIEEVIVATRPSVEGEATALLVAQILKPQQHLKVTRIARGLPHGSELEYADNRTLEQALQNRTAI